MRKLFILVLSVFMITGCAAPAVVAATATPVPTPSVAESIDAALKRYIKTEGNAEYFNIDQWKKDFDVYQVINSDSGKEHVEFKASDIADVLDALSKTKLTRLDTAKTPQSATFVWTLQVFTSKGGKANGDSITLLATTETQFDVYLIKGSNQTVRLAFIVTAEQGKELRALASKH